MKRFKLYTSNRSIDLIKHLRDEGALLLDPPYQRGDVWGELRRVNLFRSLLKGVPIASLIINNRVRAGWADDTDYAVIDGRQRCRTILMFFDGELRVPGEFFGLDGQVTYQDLDIVRRRKFKSKAVAVCESTLGTLEEEAEVFELVNYGGVPQGESDA